MTLPIEPSPAPHAGQLPHTLTFFLNSDDRRRVLAALKRYHQCRAIALLMALGVSAPPEHAIERTSAQPATDQPAPPPHSRRTRRAAAPGQGGA